MGVGVESEAPLKLPPDQTVVTWHGAAFSFDVGACRQAVVKWLLGNGKQLQDLAEAAGVSRMSLWRFMQGQRCSPATIYAILAVVGIAPGDVLASILM